MSSPSLPCSSVDFLTKWMPSSTRAGVILAPSPDLAGSLRHMTAAVSAPLHPDDSFSSDFAPLPASTDSSFLDADGCVGGTRPVNNQYPPALDTSDGQVQNLEQMASKTQDLPLMMKLEELRKWQQQMHEQLKAQQLEELLCLQEEQQKLLGIVNVSQICTERSGLPGAQWQRNAVQHSPERSCVEVEHGLCELQLTPTRSQEQLSGREEHEDEENNSEDSCEENLKQNMDHGNISEPCGATMQREANTSLDRPIKPGIGGQKKTFEELLEEQLRLEEQRLKSARQQANPTRAEASVCTKRPFLKRGQGLSRFTNNSKSSSQKEKDKKHQKPPAEARAITRSHSAPGSILKGGSNGVPQLPVQRKTAILNKENRLKGRCSPPQDIRAEKAPQIKVLGSHQRQNTGPATVQTEPKSRQIKHLLGQEKEQNVGIPVQAVRNSGCNLQPNPVTKQVGLIEGPGRPARDDGKEKSSGSGVESAEVEAGPPQDSFELSFQEKLQGWECKRQLERMELGEFELLEQAAEELSFSSNSSFVMKVLNSKPRLVLRMDQQKRQAAIGRHNRRLSSTPIKSTSGSQPTQSGGVEHTDDVSECNGFPLESGAPAGNVIGGPLKSKESDVNEGGQDDSGSEFGGKEVTIEGTLRFLAPSNPTYDKWSYQDEESLKDSASDREEENDGDTSGADDSTLIEDRESQQRKVVFDDDDTWDDLEDTAIREESPVQNLTARGVSPPQKTLLRKVAVSRGLEAEPTPASQLMTRLFPSLKPKAQNAAPPDPPPASDNKPQGDTAQQVQSRQLRERLAELEIEIERFKKENAALIKLRQENEKRQEDLRKERLEFEQTKAEELAKFEEYKKEENRKLQKERKLFEKHASAARAVPDKKKREEIQSLKQQLSSLQEELKRKESRWASTHSRLRQQIDSLHQDNGALQDEIRTLEKLRLSGWKKSSASAEKGVQTKDAPSVSDSGVPPVPKGVTFAPSCPTQSPLDSRESSCSPPLSSNSVRRNSKEISQGGAGMKSSLRRPAASGSSSSSSSAFPTRKVDEKLRSGYKNQEKQSDQSWEPLQDRSAKTDLVPKNQESFEAKELDPPQEVITHPDGKTEKVLPSGDRLIVFPNGTRKEVSADGLSAKVTFFNGDTKQITADQRVIYYYAEAQTTHITYPDGMEVLHFPNNQTEKHFPDGRKEITFPDQTVKNLFPDGREESVLTDGTIIQVNPDGTKEIHFNTGQKEIHTAEFKRREYPDGTVKTVYSDGRQETRYPTGRLRVKDKDGNVLLDKQA
ncbi:centromere protein J isoform X2 [Cyprinodon tularosa]|uniref:centromere protein J isoform X2 n=1 Tax=Cyprinodon tularosa TaxID=77115 RepID=UPI0018E25164|nr:centromere protein J isoform X2 [Cyprinodon tularosa]